MYHITDFEAPFESEKEDEDPLLDHPQQQCLPVDDFDDSGQSPLTVDGRRYLKQVRVQATQYRLIRTSAHIPAADTRTVKQVDSPSPAMSHPFWNSKTLIASILHKFKYARKLNKMHRKHVSEARTGIELHFDIGRAVRTRQWWLEYCFGSAHSRNGPTHWDGDTKDSDQAWHDLKEGEEEDEEDEDDDDDDNEEFVSQNDKLDFDRTKVALGESLLASLTLCITTKENMSPLSNTHVYANGHQPQISFLCELDQTEVVRVLRFFRIWLHRDGYRPQLGVWMFGLLSLLDSVQTGDVYHELRLLFVTCNQARMRTLLEASALKTERDKPVDGKLVLSTCNTLSASVTGSKCAACERVSHLHKRHATLCLVMLIIGYYFGQKDLIGALESYSQKNA